MPTIWVIEKQQENKISPITRCILGNYPTRVFASFNSFKKLLHTNSKNLPDILLIDYDQIISETSIKEITEIYLPMITKILITANQISINDPNVLTYTKPIDEINFLKFIKNLLLSSTPVKLKNTIRFKDTIIDFDKFVINTIYDNVKEELAPKEARILKLLIEHQGKCVNRDLIKNEIWPNTKVTQRVIDSHISRLRKKLQHTEIIIENLYGSGYIIK